MEEYFHIAIDLLKQIIAIPSLSGDEGLRADFLSDWLENHGHVVERYDNNLIVSSIIHDNFPLVLLNTHMDTVKPVDGWEMDPFLPEELDGKIYGLGSNDAGASLVSLIIAFLLLSEEVRDYNLKLLISAEEENSGPKGISSVIEKVGKIDFAVVGEPTGMDMAVCERGLLVLDGYAKGKAGHVAHHTGDNAIYKALRDIEKIRNMSFDKESEFLGKVKAEVTQIEGGYQHNTVPDKCHFVVDVRVNELYTNEEIAEYFQEKLESEIVPRSYRLRSSFINADHPIVKLGVDMGLKTFGSHTMSDQALIPAPSVKIGPGDSQRSHNADEYIETEEIKKGIDIYYKLLTNIEL